MKNVHPVYSAGIRTHNLQIIGKSPPITTRTGISPIVTGLNDKSTPTFLATLKLNGIRDKINLM